jgi:tRNA pseudouridine38-40 synthase
VYLCKKNSIVRYFIEIAYHGAAYCGWQRQPNELSVQQVLEEAMTTFLRRTIVVVSAGRTDAGVHAKQLFAHFDIEVLTDIPHTVYRINSLLPMDISVTSILPVVEDAHARFHATERAYEYHIEFSKNPFSTGLTHQIYKTPNVDLMNAAALLLLGHQDFQCFSRTNTDVKTYYCDVKNAKWEVQDTTMVFTITADRFLRNMVRAIVGTLLDVGFDKTSLEDLKHILASKDRRNAGTSAPAQGLYLTGVAYPEHIFTV